MGNSILLGLIQNVAILLCFSLLYEYFWLRKIKIKFIGREILSGLLIGGIAIVLMMTSWTASTGIVFDTRSIILSTAGLFFGFLPTVIAMIIAGIYRFMLGGNGLYMGLAVIASSGIIGILWRQFVPRIGNQLKWIELLLLGIVVHAVMLVCTILLPSDTIYETLSYLILPLLTVYPFGNMLLGLFMNRQLENVQFRKSYSSSEEKYTKLYESMSDAFIALDLDCNVIECNQTLQKMLGYSEQELLNMNCDKLTPAKWKNLDEKIIKEEVLLTGSSDVYMKECIKKDGTLLPVEWRMHLLKDEMDEPKGYWALVRDVSLRQNALNQVENERARLETILQTVPEMIWLKDTQGKYVSCNNNFAEFNGFKESDLIGESDFFLYQDKKLANFYSQKDLEVIQSRKTIRFVSWAKSANKKKEILTETIKTPMYDSKGEIIGVLGVSRDISEIKKAENELKKAKEKAEESDKLKSIFLANMSHEIRTPMNAIMGFSELLVAEEIEEVERVQYVNIIQQSGNRLLQIIDDIVDLSKLEMNQIKVVKSGFNLFNLLKESISIFEKSELLQSKPNLELAVKIKESLKNLQLYSDSARIQQVIDNLVNNSIKFSDSGRVELGCNLIDKDDKIFAEIFVKDDGIGIPKDKHDVIFERFRQGDEEQFNDGTGLGLSICKGLVELLGGDIRFESELGEGSTFYFTIPLEKKSNNQINNSSDKNPCSNNNQTTRILIAENDYNSFLYMKKLFENQNVEIVYADNGINMVEKLKENAPDLLIMDLDMPGKDCLLYLDKIKKMQHNTKVIAQSGIVLQEEKERCIGAGCDGFISKPFNKDQLFTEIKRVLS